MSSNDNRSGQSGPEASKGQYLRRLAEEIARERAASSPDNLTALSAKETQHVLHELQVHQIELEMQNEELRRIQVELGAAGARYFDLYDLAPVGYITVSEKGLIIEANLTSARLLGLGRGELIKKPFTRFILNADQDIYYRHHKQLFETEKPQVCELRMVKKDETKFWAHLAATAAHNTDCTLVSRTIINDINELKQANEQIKSQLKELRRWQHVMMGREGRVQEIKREVNELCRRIGEPIRYHSQEDGPADSEKK